MYVHGPPNRGTCLASSPGPRHLPRRQRQHPGLRTLLDVSRAATVVTGGPLGRALDRGVAEPSFSSSRFPDSYSFLPFVTARHSDFLLHSIPLSHLKSPVSSNSITMAEAQLHDFPSLFSLKGKVAVVTGGSRGLGLHAASAYGPH